MKFLFQDYRFQKFQKQRKKRKSETRAFSLSHGAVVNPMREVHRRLGGENHGDIKNQKISVKSVLSVWNNHVCAPSFVWFVRFVFEKISVKSVLSVWNKNMPYPCDEVREFSIEMRVFFIEMRVFFIEVRVFSVEMREICFFKPSA